MPTQLPRVVRGADRAAGNKDSYNVVPAASSVLSQPTSIVHEPLSMNLNINKQNILISENGKDINIKIPDFQLNDYSKDIEDIKLRLDKQNKYINSTLELLEFYYKTNSEFKVNIENIKKDIILAINNKIIPLNDIDYQEITKIISEAVVFDQSDIISKIEQVKKELNDSINSIEIEDSSDEFKNLLQSVQVIIDDTNQNIISAIEQTTLDIRTDLETIQINDPVSNQDVIDYVESIKLNDFIEKYYLNMTRVHEHIVESKNELIKRNADIYSSLISDINNKIIENSINNKLMIDKIVQEHNNAYRDLCGRMVCINNNVQYNNKILADNNMIIKSMQDRLMHGRFYTKFWFGSLIGIVLSTPIWYSFYCLIHFFN